MLQVDNLGFSSEDFAQHPSKGSPSTLGTPFIGRRSIIYRKNGLVQNAEITDSELESEDGTLSADHRYTNLLWKAQLSKTHPLLRDESDYESRPLMIIIMFLGKPPFPKAARRRN